MKLYSAAVEAISAECVYIYPPHDEAGANNVVVGSGAQSRTSKKGLRRPPEANGGLFRQTFRPFSSLAPLPPAPARSHVFQKQYDT